MNSYQMNNLKVLLADTLCEKTEGYIIEQLFERFPTIVELLDVTEQELLTIKGIGKVKSLQIISALKLARALNVPVQTPKINFIRMEPTGMMRVTTSMAIIEMDLTVMDMIEVVLTKTVMIAEALIKMALINEGTTSEENT